MILNFLRRLLSEYSFGCSIGTGCFGLKPLRLLSLGVGRAEVAKMLGRSIHRLLFLFLALDSKSSSALLLRVGFEPYSIDISFFLKVVSELIVEVDFNFPLFFYFLLVLDLSYRSGTK